VSFVLVSLVRDGDISTQASDAFARWYAEQHPPAQSFHGDSPDHEAIAQAVRQLDKRRGFVLGHGGETLRSGPGPDPLSPFKQVIVWADAQQFGSLFEDARVYVFACSTLAEEADVQSFGKRAVGHGIAVYAGHFKPIQAPDITDTDLYAERMRRALQRVVTKFLDGCNDRAQLLMEARSALSIKAHIRLKTKRKPDLSWSLDWERIFGSLKVEMPTI
jgi:hypothetical protein